MIKPARDHLRWYDSESAAARSAGRKPHKSTSGDEGVPLGQENIRKALDHRNLDAHWSARSTLMFILVICGGFWALIAFAMSFLNP
jgi:hypothetical protein